MRISDWSSDVCSSNLWLHCKTPDEAAHKGLGRTFQTAKPFTGLTVLENIMLGAFIATSDRDEAEQIALEVAAQTDLTQYLPTEARNLTVGGMKRLEIARALAIRPSIQIGRASCRDRVRPYV